MAVAIGPLVVDKTNAARRPNPHTSILLEPVQSTLPHGQITHLITIEAIPIDLKGLISSYWAARLQDTDYSGKKAYRGSLFPVGLFNYALSSSPCTVDFKHKNHLPRDSLDISIQIKSTVSILSDKHKSITSSTYSSDNNSVMTATEQSVKKVEGERMMSSAESAKQKRRENKAAAAARREEEVKKK